MAMPFVIAILKQPAVEKKKMIDWFHRIL